MRRGMRGATSRPGSPRPGMGFGRPLRPMPPRADAQRVWPETDWWAGPAAPIEEPVRAPSPSVTNDRT
jgi:hypothetical protein